MGIIMAPLGLATVVCLAALAGAQDQPSLAKASAFFTTNFGQPIFTDSYSLTVGERGASRVLARADRSHLMICDTWRCMPHIVWESLVLQMVAISYAVCPAL